MIGLDLPTLSVVGLLSSILLPAVLYAAGSISQADLATRAWVRGALFYSIGFVGLAFRGNIPDLIAIVLANALMVLGYGEILMGVRLYFDIAINRRWLWRMLALYIAVQSWLTYITPSLPGRVALASVYLLVLSLLIARELVSAIRSRNDPGGDTSSRSLLGILASGFILSGLVMGARVLAFILPALETTVATLSAISFLSGIAVNFLLAAGLPLLVALREKSNLHRSELSLRRAQQLAELGSIEIDLATGVAKTNGVLNTLLGIAPELAPAIENLLQLVHPDDRERMAIRYRDAINGRAIEPVVEYRIVRPSDGAIRWINSISERYADSIDNAQSLVFTLRDVTGIKQAALATEEAARAKSEFFAMMSHEIRTPMNGVLGMAQLLLQDKISEDERKEYARTIVGSGKTLLTLLNDILDLSKIEAGRMTLAEEVFDPDELIKDTVRLFSENAQGKGLQLSAEVHCRGERFCGDPVRLRQMVSNLISNAIKFSSQGEIRVVIGECTEANRSDGRVMLEVSVSDQGIGISDGNLGKLFNSFVQADQTTTRRFGGTGLGLSIVRQLAEQMGGSVGVESREGVGSRFWFRVCLGLAATDHDNRRTERLQPVSAPHSHESDNWVLVVDDNATNRLVAGAMLKQLGIVVRFAENGQEAIESLAHGQPPSLVLMDCNMPVMDGWTATQAIRRREAECALPRQRIVALTAGALEEDRHQCLVAGMDAVLVKPLNFDDLKNLFEH